MWPQNSALTARENKYFHLVVFIPYREPAVLSAMAQLGAFLQSNSQLAGMGNCLWPQSWSCFRLVDAGGWDQPRECHGQGKKDASWWNQTAH